MTRSFFPVSFFKLLECSLQRFDFYTKYWLKMSCPFVLFAAFFTSSFIFKRSESHRFEHLRSLKGSLALFSLLISSLYTLLVAGAVSPFMCARSKGDSRVVVSSPSITCFQGKWNQNLFFFVFFMLLYAVAYPAFVIYTFWKNRDQLKSTDFLKDFGHLTTPYRNDRFYWELITFAKRGAFAVCSQIVPLYSSASHIFSSFY
jgi:hypothetical protein